MSGNWTPGQRPDTPCEEWRGALNHRGYGWRTVNNRQVLAHRQSYLDAYGSIPEGAVVMHTCDNPKCINPSHLRAGSLKDNMLDMVAKSRHAKQKLTPADVREIRRRVISDGVTAKDAGAALGVTSGMATAIIRGRAWGSIPNEDGSAYQPPPKGRRQNIKGSSH